MMKFLIDLFGLFNGRKSSHSEGLGFEVKTSNEPFKADPIEERGEFLKKIADTLKKV